ncbi:hypothetical protein LUZ60_003788 [Juncus effusus]|nr:hypothetical protein LUZ60_003788 [Juncus effusus]
MGKKGKWFGAVKKVFSPDSKEKKAQKLKNRSQIPDQIQSDPSTSTPLETTNRDPSPSPIEEVKTTEIEIEEEGKNVALAGPSVPQSATPIAAQVVVTPNPPSRFAGKSKEEIAAIKIQTAFRGYMARRALRALRGLVRLKALIDGNSVKRQAASTLRCMQTLARVQSQIRSRRLRMTEENQALQRQLLLKKELDSLRMGEEWDDSAQSKEQLEASIVSKQEAAIRRERALAYAFSHQWKSNSRTANPMFIDPSNPQWGWSWLERWMAAKPWENPRPNTQTKDTDSLSVSSLKTPTPIPSLLTEGEITKSYARRDIIINNSPKTSNNSPKSNVNSPRPLRPSPLKSKSSTPKNGVVQEDDNKSVKSEMPPRRHSLAGSVVARDDESVVSVNVPSYMAPTKSARMKSRLSSPADDNKSETPTSEKVGPAKKRLSFAGEKVGSPMRRHSGPPKVEVGSNNGN